jgi:hypothetical protein
MRIILLLCVVVTGWTQPRLLKTIELTAPATAIQIDRAGDIYIQFQSGKIEKWNASGSKISDTQPAVPLTSFDPTNAMRLLGFQRNSQTVTWFYPDLTVYEQFALEPAFAIEPWLICASGERDYWIADAADQSFKKIHAADQTVMREFKLPVGVPPIKQITAVREYQNFLFLLDPDTGLQVLNSFGKLIRTIAGKDITHFQFLGEELFYQQAQHVVFFDLFTAEIRTMNLPDQADVTLLSDERMFLLKGNSLKIFEFKP